MSLHRHIDVEAGVMRWLNEVGFEGRHDLWVKSDMGAFVLGSFTMHPSEDTDDMPPIFGRMRRLPLENAGWARELLQNLPYINYRPLSRREVKARSHEGSLQD